MFPTKKNKGACTRTRPMYAPKKEWGMHKRAPSGGSGRPERLESSRHSAARGVHFFCIPCCFPPRPVTRLFLMMTALRFSLHFHGDCSWWDLGCTTDYILRPERRMEKSPEVSLALTALRLSATTRALCSPSVFRGWLVSRRGGDFVLEGAGEGGRGQGVGQNCAAWRPAG